MQLYLASGGTSIAGYSHGSLDALASDAVRFRVRNNDGEDITVRARVVLGWAGDPLDPAGNWSTLHADTAGSMDPTGVAVGSWLSLGTFAHLASLYLWERLAPPADATAGNHGYTIEFEVTPATEPAYNLTYEFGATVINPTYKDGESTTVLADLTNFESDHPYPAGDATYTHTWTYTHATTAADSLDVTFDALTELEDGYDYLREVDGVGTVLREWTGTTLAGQTITFTGDVVRLRLDADDMYAAWGFRVTAVVEGGATGTVEASSEASAHSLATTIEASATADARSLTPLETAALIFARSLTLTVGDETQVLAHSLAQTTTVAQTGTVTTDENSTAGTPVVAAEAGGVFDITHTVTVSGHAALTVLDYKWSSPQGGADTLDVTVLGEHPEARDASISVTTIATDRHSGRVYARTFGPLPGSGECEVADGKTTLHARATALQDANQGSLAELVPWVAERKAAEEAGETPAPLPQKVPCNQKRDEPLPEISVHAVISLACPSLRRHGTGFSGETFQEKRREYETEGKTGLAVAQEILGTLNYEFTADKDGLHAYSPSYSFPVNEPEARRRTKRSYGITRAQYPTDVTAAAADEWIELPALLEELTGVPDEESFLFETSADGILATGEDAGGGNGTFGIVQKAAGRIVAEAECTIGDASYTYVDDDGNEVTITWPHVGISKTVTTHYYADDCPDRLLATVRTTTIYGYTRETLLTVDGINFGLAGRNFMRGDVIDTETQRTINQWSAQGWLAQTTTITDQVAAVAQEGLDTPTPGPLVPHGRKLTNSSVLHRPIGGGMWLTITQVSGTELTPRWDTDAELWVDLVAKSFKLPTRTQVSDQAPGQSRCPDDCESELSWVQEPQTYETSPGGPGGTVSFSWPWVADGGRLAGYVTTALHALLPRKTSTIAYDVPWAALRRGEIADGVIRSVQADGGPGSFRMEVTVEDASAAY